MHEIASREYKVMVDPRMFIEPSKALAKIGSDLRSLGQSIRLRVTGAFKATDCRWLVFLDARDHALDNAGMILRLRQPEGKKSERKKQVELTVKAMSPDHFIAVPADVPRGRASAGGGHHAE
jgi:hypothetical protein